MLLVFITEAAEEPSKESSVATPSSPLHTREKGKEENNSIKTMNSLTKNNEKAKKTEEVIKGAAEPKSRRDCERHSAPVGESEPTAGMLLLLLLSASSAELLKEPLWCDAGAPWPLGPVSLSFLSLSLNPVVQSRLFTLK